ncbi:hypothetical protein B9Z19DRAFT_985576, partial [Tuber borchii]
PAEVGLLPIERFTQQGIPVANFQETTRIQIERPHCTGTKGFRHGGPRYDSSYGDLRGRAFEQLLVLFKRRNVLREAAGLYWLALIRIIDQINYGRFDIASGHIRVSKRRTC